MLTFGSRAVIGIVPFVWQSEVLLPGSPSGLFGQLSQQAHGVLVKSLFRIIEQNLVIAQGKALKTGRVGSEQFAQVAMLDTARMFSECEPSGAKGDLHGQTATGAAMCGCGS